jgi:Stage II sporulation protein M
MPATKATLRRWDAAPWKTVRGWLALSLAIALGLLVTVWLSARGMAPTQMRVQLPGVTEPATLRHVGFLLWRNSLVLALHALACVAGFIARSSLPAQAQQHRGAMRVVHERAGDVAIVFVLAATLFSLVSQAIVLSHGAATMSFQLGMTPTMLLLGVLPHAVPELVALFLPLAAWMTLTRQRRWDELLAATIVTVALAMPVLLVAATIETFASPQLLVALSGG